MSSPDLTTVAEQYAALTSAAGICDLSGRTRIELTGDDRQKFLNNFCTGDVLQLTSGTGCEAFVTSVPGKTISHGHVFCYDKRLVFDTVPGQAETLLPHFEKYHITEALEIIDRTAEDAALLLAGPTAADLLAKLAGFQPPAEPNSHAPSTIEDAAGDSAPIDVARLPLAGEQSLYITCARADLPAVHAALIATGPIACEAAALDMVRVEAGYPLFGRDISPANLPQEVSRDSRAISFTKGCYLGQETVARIDALGHVNRKLVGVRFSGDSMPSPGDEITAEPGGGNPVGQVTSAVSSPRLGCPLALAYVRSQHAEAGHPLGWQNAAAEVVALPLK